MASSPSQGRPASQASLSIPVDSTNSTNITAPARSVSAAKNKEVPASLSKYFKTTAKARKLMATARRICELDPTNSENVLVYSTYHRYHPTKWRQMVWSQQELWEMANDDPFMRVSRVSPASQNLKAGGILKIFDGDFFNPDPKDSETRGDFVTEIALGCDQVKMPWIYLISEKMAPETEEEHDERHAPFPSPQTRPAKFSRTSAEIDEIERAGLDTDDTDDTLVGGGYVDGASDPIDDEYEEIMENVNAFIDSNRTEEAPSREESPEPKSRKHDSLNESTNLAGKLADMTIHDGKVFYEGDDDGGKPFRKGLGDGWKGG